MLEPDCEDIECHGQGFGIHFVHCVALENL